MVSHKTAADFQHLRWSTPDYESSVVIERPNEEKYNLTNELYNITPKITAILNPCQDGRNVTLTLNKTNYECSSGSQYDTVKLVVVALLCLLIVVTVIGNTLIILAVLTTKRLRTVTNCFVTSLAVADWLVGIFVMPPAIAVHLRGQWELGWILCDIWISLDILLCTASILSLCAISIDRYLAVTRPLTYSRRRRSKNLALTMILCVWLAAAAITCPPMLGWYEPDHNLGGVCRYNQNAGYVLFSATGSFFLPMGVMVYVYARISCVVARRHHQLASAPPKDAKRSRLSCVREDSNSGSVDKTTGRRGCRETSYTTKTSQGHQRSDSTAQAEPDCPCCFRENSQRPQHSRSKECHLYHQTNDILTYKANPKYRSTLKSRSMRDSSENNRVSSLRRETKTAQTLSLVVGGFVACWLPFFLYYILTPFIAPEYVNAVLMYVLTWLGWFNSAINPFIYAFYSVEFRLAFWRLTIRKCLTSRR